MDDRKEILENNNLDFDNKVCQKCWDWKPDISADELIERGRAE